MAPKLVQNRSRLLLIAVHTGNPAAALVNASAIGTNTITARTRQPLRKGFSLWMTAAITSGMVALITGHHSGNMPGFNGWLAPY